MKFAESTQLLLINSLENLSTFLLIFLYLYFHLLKLMIIQTFLCLWLPKTAMRIFFLVF